MKKKSRYKTAVFFLLRIFIPNTQFKYTFFTLLCVTSGFLYCQDKKIVLSDSISLLKDKNVEVFDNNTTDIKLYVANSYFFNVKNNSLHVHQGLTYVNYTPIIKNKNVVKTLIKITNSKLDYLPHTKHRDNTKPKTLVKSLPYNSPFAPYYIYMRNKAFTTTITSYTKKVLKSSPLALSVSYHITLQGYNINISNNKNLNDGLNLLNPVLRYIHYIIARPPPAC